jgi:hypothetical protein
MFDRGLAGSLRIAPCLLDLLIAFIALSIAGSSDRSSSNGSNDGAFAAIVWTADDGAEHSTGDGGTRN